MSSPALEHTHDKKKKKYDILSSDKCKIGLLKLPDIDFTANPLILFCQFYSRYWLLPSQKWPVFSQCLIFCPNQRILLRLYSNRLYPKVGNGRQLYVMEFLGHSGNNVCTRLCNYMLRQSLKHEWLQLNNTLHQKCLSWPVNFLRLSWFAEVWLFLVRLPEKKKMSNISVFSFYDRQHKLGKFFVWKVQQ